MYVELRILLSSLKPFECEETPDIATPLAEGSMASGLPWDEGKRRNYQHRRRVAVASSSASTSNDTFNECQQHRQSR